MAKIMLYTTEPKSFVQEEFEKYAKEGGHSLEIVNPLECAVLQSETGNAFIIKGEPIGDFDFCIPRMSEDDLDFKVLSMRYFEENGVKVLNTGEAMAKASNKVDMQIAINAAGIKTPKSILLNDKDFLDQAVEWLDGKFPVIVKTIYGTHGVGVIKADSLGSLRSIIQQLIKSKDQFMIQEFIEHDKAYRILALDGEVLGAVSRTTAPNDFRTNAHQGSEVSKHEPSDNEIDICVKAAKAVGLKLAAVDYILIDSEVVILEVNGSPGFESMQEVVEDSIGKKIIEYVTTRLGTNESENDKKVETVDENEEESKDKEADKKGSNSDNPADDKEQKIIEPEKEKIQAADYDVIGAVNEITIKYFNDEKPISARIDTGAEYSSISGSNIEIDDETVSFGFGDFRYRFSLVKNVNVVNSNGKDERPIIRLDVILNGKLIRNVEFSVANRDGLKYDALIGRRALAQANMIVSPVSVAQVDSKTGDELTKKSEEE